MTKPAGKAAAPKRGAAAVAEKKVKHVKFLGLDLEIPPKLPGTVIFDFAAMENADGRSLGPIVGLISSVVGVEQVAAIKAQVALKGIDLDEVSGALTELLTSIFAAYGVEVGE